jgi:degradative hydroxymethylglutaryl-CoA reductase
LLEYKGFDGSLVAERIVEAYEWANDDPYRAVTHNKGIMNGIDAVAIATGQDWRAIEAACHCYAVNEHYRSLSKYWIEEEVGFKYLCGSLELPIPVGTHGGVIGSHPMYQYALGLLGNPDTPQLAMVH